MNFVNDNTKFIIAYGAVESTLYAVQLFRSHLFMNETTIVFLLWQQHMNECVDKRSSNFHFRSGYNSLNHESHTNGINTHWFAIYAWEWSRTSSVEKV